MQSSKIAVVDRAVTRPVRYWLVVAIAIAVAESAHAPLVGERGTDAPARGAIAKTTEVPQAALPPGAVHDPLPYQPLAFEDKNTLVDQKKERRPDRVHRAPPTFEAASVNPTDSLDSAPSAPTQLGDAIPSTDLTGAGYTDPLPDERPPFAADNPFTAQTEAQVNSIRHTVTSPVTPVPEPASAIPSLYSFLLLRRRRRGGQGDPTSPTRGGGHKGVTYDLCPLRFMSAPLSQRS